MPDRGPPSGERDLGEYRLSLRVWHPVLTGEEIAGVVQRSPKRLCTAGEPRTTAKGKQLKGINQESFGVFEIARGPIPELATAIAVEADRLANVGQLKKLTDDGRGRLEFFVGIFLRDNTGYVLPAETSGKLAELGIGLSFDMYCDQDD